MRQSGKILGGGDFRYVVSQPNYGADMSPSSPPPVSVPMRTITTNAADWQEHRNTFSCELRSSSFIQMSYDQRE